MKNTIVPSYLLFLNLLLMSANTTTAQQPAQQQGHFANVNGIRMYYEIHGKGEPLVLIHGGGSTIGTTFGRVLPLFARTHQVIAVELQAHGHTSDRNEPETFEQDADDVATLLQHLNINKASLLGFSNGGTTAMQVAIRHPQLVDKLVIASGLFRRNGAYPWLWAAMDKAKLENMPKELKEAFLEINPDTAALQNMHDKDANRMRAFKDFDDEDLKNIQAKATLIVIADQDVVTPEHAVEMYRLVPNARLAIFPGTHGAYLGEITTLKDNNKLYEPAVATIEEFLQQK